MVEAKKRQSFGRHLEALWNPGAILHAGNGPFRAAVGSYNRESTADGHPSGPLASASRRRLCVSFWLIAPAAILPCKQVLVTMKPPAIRIIRGAALIRSNTHELVGHRSERHWSAGVAQRGLSSSHRPRQLCRRPPPA